jgi:hypothetical protein
MLPISKKVVASAHRETSKNKARIDAWANAANGA